MLQIDVKTDSARLVQTEANVQILGRLSEAVVRVQVAGRATHANSIQRRKLAQQCIKQTEHRRRSSHAREPLHQELEQDAIALCAMFGRVRAVRLGEGERRGDGLSICDQRLRTIVEHRRVQRRQRSIECDTTPRPGEIQARGLQFLIRAEPERAGGCAICESVGERQSCGRLHQGLQCCTHDKARISCGWPITPTLCPEVLGIQNSVRNSTGARNSVQQCCMLEDKLQRERRGSNLAIDCNVRGMVREYSSDTS